MDWTTAHPGPLSDGEPTAAPRVVDAATGYKMPVWRRTSRADVAVVMLRAIGDPETYGKRVLMTSVRQAT